MQPPIYDGGNAFWKDIFNAAQAAYYTLVANDADYVSLTIYLQCDQWYPNWPAHNYQLTVRVYYDTEEMLVWIGRNPGNQLYYDYMDGVLHNGEVLGFESDGAGTLTAHIGLQTISVTDPDPITTPGYIGIAMDDTNCVAAIGNFGGGDGISILAPDRLEAHIAGPEITLSWNNQPPPYTYLRVERSTARTGPWTDMQLGLEPTDEVASDNSPGDFSSFYRVYVENPAGSATTDPVQAAEFVRQTWNEVAHAMGIPDLSPPPAPFVYGEAGEQLFLVCCRLWHLAITPGLPDPVYSNPEDWRTFIETGTYPT